MLMPFMALWQRKLTWMPKGVEHEYGFGKTKIYGVTRKLTWMPKGVEHDRVCKAHVLGFDAETDLDAERH